jgi:hypothetical protein
MNYRVEPLDAGFSPQSLEFSPGWICVRLAATEVALEQICFPGSSVLVLLLTPPLLHSSVIAAWGVRDPWAGSTLSYTVKVKLSLCLNN